MTKNQTFEKPTKFEWDEGNSTKSYLKHKVTQCECEEIFSNRLVISKDKDHSRKEERFLALGETNNKLRLMMAYTIRNKKIRVISARPANRKERSLYEKSI
ncbi:BrnT family toxin [Candidatus Parcubacteria bacterium]|nr:BrnT family toxin [Patescibacteria group bacterium]MCG2688978.1 BrnT family toxin [Candidatus Parcubacteria bacterium]